jgi:hypothetical protein
MIGENLASTAGLNCLLCPVRIPSFTVKLHWHSRYQNDSGNRWLRGVCVEIFQQTRSPSSDWLVAKGGGIIDLANGNN